MSTLTITEQAVWDMLREVPDPEIPTINLVDLGVIRNVVVGERILVEMMPTFVGCPALDVMQREIKKMLSAYGPTTVKIIFDEIWTTECITEAGRKMLQEAKITPPPHTNLINITARKHATEAVAHECPNCHSTNTYMENLFGPTPCRAISYCDACHQPFEQFKAV